MMLRFIAVFALVGALAFLPACVTDPVTGKTSIGIDRTDDEEVTMAAPHAASFKAQYEGAYPDPEIQRYCERIVLGLTKDSPRHALPWNFTILNSSDVNAFALPGGTVCITRGLLWQLGSEAEFAGVMGHEVGHVDHKHSAKGEGRATIFNILLLGAGVAAESSDSDWARAGVIGFGVAGQLTMLHYSRDQELESDRRGIYYAYEAGYDPRELANVFELFKRLKGGGGGPSWLSSHPMDDDRIAQVNKLVAREYPNLASRRLTVSTPEWNRLMTRLRADQRIYERYDEAAVSFAEAIKSGNDGAMPRILDELRACERERPKHAIFTSATGVVQMRMGRTSEAKSAFQRAAALQPDLFEPHIYLAQIAFDRGERSTVIREAEAAAKIFPNHPSPYYLAARTYDSAGQTQQAVTHYQSVVQRAPEESEQYRYSYQRLQALGVIR